MNRMLMMSGALWVVATAHAAVASDAPTDRPAAPSSATASNAASPLDRRIALLARELDLDAAQRLRVRTVLENQREQIVRVWQDETLSGAVRVARTRAISERTEEAIRALLTDAQRRKYIQPRPDRPAAGTDDLATYVDRMDRR